MKRSENRILTTHVGSLARPKALLDAIKARTESPARQAEYEALLDREIAQVVKRQAEVGLDIINDGEFGKENWATYVLKRMSGFEIRPDQKRPLYWLGRDLERFHEAIVQDMPPAATGGATEACVGPITYQDRSGLDRELADFTKAVKNIGPREAFFTAVAPASTAFNGVNEYYKTDRDYAFAIAEALRVEYQAIIDAGVILQVDDAVLANMYDHLVSESPAKYREWAEVRIEALNHALRGIPEDRVRYHVCFGSWHVPHVSDAPLEEIVDLILNVKAGAYSIEAANPRHEHEWRVWEKVKLPPGKILIPGVVTHHTTTVEHPRVVADRIVRYAKIVGRENVIAGTDCGFAQTEAIRRVHPEVMWAKFESLVEGARLASHELWGRAAAA
ncbi:MAG TPA: cobalamin-independent methionine synthase II family protein [Hyphomicrobiales bacterium]|nr:cobalamin-independent methionine synthase II family protein [Hyphomicrobiales bacterium]